jgi:hypothetical protein
MTGVVVSVVGATPLTTATASAIAPARPRAVRWLIVCHVDIEPIFAVEGEPDRDTFMASYTYREALSAR